MQNLPTFLQSLELDADADERAIRRAYARKLKQIDQENDPAAFQQLREAYEAALAWTDRQSGQPVADVRQVHRADTAGSDAPGETPDYRPRQGWNVPTPQPAVHSPHQENPYQLANAVFADFQAAYGRLMEAGKPGRAFKARKAAHGQELVAWRRELDRSLADDRLVNIAARNRFEALVANTLANGWQPGNEILFAVAVDIFGWGTDRNRLSQLGQAGMLVDRAIDEREMFFTQSSDDKLAQRKVLEMLRSAAPPSEKQVKSKIIHIHKLMTRFPALMSISVNAANAGRWPELYEKLPPRKRGEARKWRFLHGEKRAVKFFLGVGFVLLIHFGPKMYRDSTRPASDNPSHSASAVPRKAPPQPKSLPVTQEQMDEIFSRIQYKPGRKVKEGRMFVDYKVFLDADGKVLGMNKQESSGDPVFHEAVKKALSGFTFPPGTSVVFVMHSAIEVHRRKNTPPRMSEQELKKLMEETFLDKSKLLPLPGLERNKRQSNPSDSP